MNELNFESKKSSIGIRTDSAVQSPSSTLIEIIAKKYGTISMWTKTIILCFVFIGFYPIMIFACMLLPTWWNGFTFHGIKAYQMDLPSKKAGYYFHTKSNDRYLKLFPVICSFYNSFKCI
jgi:hypothetical protein